MVDYTCVICSAKIPGNLLGRKIRCPHCSSKAIEKVCDRVLEPIKAV